MAHASVTPRSRTTVHMPTGVAVSVAAATVAAVFSGTWPLSMALTTQTMSLAVLAFTLALAVGAAFLGMLAGLVFARGWRAVLGQDLRLSRPAVLTLALAALALGAWFGQLPAAP